MRILVSGSAGHLGEALVRTLQARGDEVIGLDRHPSPYTHAVGSIGDAPLVRRCLEGVEAVLHTATLHKPHVALCERQAFLYTNLTGTLTLLTEAQRAGVGAFVFTSTTSVFGRALSPPPDRPAAWVDEALTPIPKNIYGGTKAAAEDLCALASRDGLPCVVLRTSRFFPEADDNPAVCAAFDDANAKVNELLYRRVDLEDVVSAHLCALQRAPQLGFGTYVVSATTPLQPDDRLQLRRDPAAVVERRVPGSRAIYERLGWRMFADLGRVYVNTRAREALGWRPRIDFRWALDQLEQGLPPSSALARAVGAKGYR